MHRVLGIPKVTHHTTYLQPFFHDENLLDENKGNPRNQRVNNVSLKKKNRKIMSKLR